jgi:hypothetical protein
VPDADRGAAAASTSQDARALRFNTFELSLRVERAGVARLFNASLAARVMSETINQSSSDSMPINTLRACRDA